MAEIIYMRCSTRPQATGDSLSRQLSECLCFARKRNLFVGWVFCDIASGDGRLPQRDAAMALAKQKRCSVLVESSCRWSRAPAEGEAFEFFASGRVIQCSDSAREFELRLGRVIKEAANGR